MLTGLVSPVASLPGLQMVSFSLCPHMTLSSVYPEKESERDLIVCLSLLRRTAVLLDEGPTLTTSFNLVYLHQGPISNSHIRS